jgi:hypothetical protein
MRVLLVVLLALAALPAGAAPRVSGITARQVASLEVQVAVTISRPTPLDIVCDTTVMLGDGNSRLVNFGVGDRHTRTLQHKYAVPGTYKVSAKGAGRCQGAKDVTVNVTR